MSGEGADARRTGYEADWERRELGRFDHPTGNLRVDRAYEMIPGARRLLDVGCGEGQLPAVLRAKVPFRVGADVSPEALRRAGPWCRGVAADLEDRALPFRSRSFDLVTCLDVIEHLYDPRRVIAELARVLSDDGRLYISVPNARYLVRIKELVLGRFPVAVDGGPFYDAGHLHCFAARNLEELCREHGLVLDRIEGIFSSGLRRWKVRLVEFLLRDRLRVEFLAIGIVLRFKRR